MPIFIGRVASDKKLPLQLVKAVLILRRCQLLHVPLPNRFPLSGWLETAEVQVVWGAEHPHLG